MEYSISTLKNILEQRLPVAGIRESGISGVGLFRRDIPYKKRPQLYHPQIIILAQGKKNVYLGNERFVYDPEHYYVQTVPLPVECEAVIENNKPMLGIVIKIDPKIIGEILFDMEVEPQTGKERHKSLYDAPLSDQIIEPAIRLLESLKSKNEQSVLGPIYLKEILFKILNGENGEILRELASNNRGFYQISRVISDIHEHYSRPIEIQSLAREAGMSPTAFHATFKAMTRTSPLQYIKNIRLHKAREIIQSEGEKAYAAAMRVGYESTSQFSREYKRCFGITPVKDRQNKNDNLAQQTH